jgi:hypothetical protein
LSDGRVDVHGLVFTRREDRIARQPAPGSRSPW